MLPTIAVVHIYLVARAVDIEAAAARPPPIQVASGTRPIHRRRRPQRSDSRRFCNRYSVVEFDGIAVQPANQFGSLYKKPSTVLLYHINRRVSRNSFDDATTFARRASQVRLF